MATELWSTPIFVPIYPKGCFTGLPSRKYDIYHSRYNLMLTKERSFRGLLIFWLGESAMGKWPDVDSGWPECKQQVSNATFERSSGFVADNIPLVFDVLEDPSPGKNALVGSHIKGRWDYCSPYSKCKIEHSWIREGTMYFVVMIALNTLSIVILETLPVRYVKFIVHHLLSLTFFGSRMIWSSSMNPSELCEYRRDCL